MTKHHADRIGSQMDHGQIEEILHRLSQLEVDTATLRSELSSGAKTAIPGSVAEEPQGNSHSNEQLLDVLANGDWPTKPRQSTPNGWDSLVDPWVDAVPTIGDKVPSAYRIWQSSRRYFLKGDLERASRCERLNYIMHNSYVPAELDLKDEVTFAYGGIGVIVHKDSEIQKNVTIGANVTIGGNGHQQRFDERKEIYSTVPKIGELTTIGACANISGGIELGPMTIVAPNAVVTKSFGPGSILGGVPAKKIGQITVENALRYKAKFLPARRMNETDYQELAEALLANNIESTDDDKEKNHG